VFGSILEPHEKVGPDSYKPLVQVQLGRIFMFVWH